MLSKEEVELIQKRVTPNQNEWVIKGNKVVYRDYIGQNGLLAKSASEMLCYLYEEKQKTDINLQKAFKNIRLIKTERISMKGNPYTEISFEGNDLAMVLTVVNSLTRGYREEWKKYNTENHKNY